jgi:hypothetical protein
VFRVGNANKKKEEEEEEETSFSSLGCFHPPLAH